MRAVQGFLYDPKGNALPTKVKHVEITEQRGRSAVYVITVDTTTAFAGDTIWWRGSAMVVKVGTSPMLTERQIVVEGSKKTYEIGTRVTYQVTGKCRSSRYQMADQDRVWENTFLVDVVRKIARSYGMRAVIDVEPEIKMVTVRQREDDWTFLQEICKRLDGEVFIIGTKLHVESRDKRLMAKPVRTYVRGVHPFTFEATDARMGRVGAAGTNRKHVIKGLLDGKVQTDAVKEDPGLGKESLFKADDKAGGEMKMAVPVTASPSGMNPPTQTGQFDSGAPTPVVDWDAIYLNKRAKGERRAQRDYTNRAKITYVEWDPRGTPMPGAKVEVVNIDDASEGAYYIHARTMGLMPGINVTLNVTRHSTNKRNTGKTRKEKIAALLKGDAAGGNYEVKAQSPDSTAPSAPVPLQDFGGA